MTTTLNGKFDQVKEYLLPRSQEENDQSFKKHLRNRYSIDMLPGLNRNLTEEFFKRLHPEKQPG
jgi:hypothetical protein